MTDALIGAMVVGYPCAAYSSNTFARDGVFSASRACFANHWRRDVPTSSPDAALWARGGATRITQAGGALRVK